MHIIIECRQAYSSMDKAIADAYKRKGVKLKLGVDGAKDCNIFVKGNRVFYVYA